jgi:hypothetical protein
MHASNVFASASITVIMVDNKIFIAVYGNNSRDKQLAVIEY